MRRCRYGDGNEDAPQKVPGWSGFNAAVSSTTPEPSVVGYCPVIRGILNRTVDSVHSPTEVDGDGQDARIRGDHHCHGLYMPKHKRSLAM